MTDDVKNTLFEAQRFLKIYARQLAFGDDYDFIQKSKIEEIITDLEIITK